MKSLQTFVDSIPKLLTVIPSMMLLFISIVIAGILIGLWFASIKLGKSKVGNLVISVIISFERGTPLLIQTLIVYFGLRAVFMNGFGMAGVMKWNPAIFAFVAYAINLGSFLCETFRGAYLVIDVGQIEAGKSIGMTKGQIFRRIILPQGARIALPNMGNQLLDDFKALSLAFSIGVIELMGKGTNLVNRSMGVGAIGIYGAVALMFWLICFLMDKFFTGLERYLSKDIRVSGKAN